MSSIIEQTVATIKREHLTPLPRHQVLLRRLAIWGVGVLVIGVAALALATGYELALDLDWDFPTERSVRGFIFLFGSLPLFWIMVTGLLSVIAAFAVRHTEGGYRLSLLTLVGGVSAAIILSGLLFACNHAGKRMHESLRREMPLYHQLVPSKEGRWSQPHNGFLGGVIITVQSDGFELASFREEHYLVILTPHTDIAPSVQITDGEMVRILGRAENQNRFVAEVIRPFRAGRGARMPWAGQR